MTYLSTVNRFNCEKWAFHTKTESNLEQNVTLQLILHLLLRKLHKDMESF